MATNPSKPPPQPPNENNTDQQQQQNSILKQRSTICSCSNISIMQLFHEMKQKFPTVPDHIVSELVTKNCHNRPACLNSLEEALIGTPVPAQSYPSQSIHNNSTNSLKRKIKNKLDSFCSSGTGSSGSESLSSSRENSVDKKISENLNQSLNLKQITNSDMSSSSGGDNNNNLNYNHNFNQNNNNINISDNYENSDNPSNNNDNNRIANRPNSLPISNIGIGLQHFGRPTRTAPPPPLPNVAVSPSPHDGLNVSLNVTVSPVSSRSPRCLSTLQVQPEHPYSREALHNSFSHNNNNSNNNNRSSTSVNLTLRQPTNSPQSPINVIASPSPRLTYSSRTYDAKQGYESKLEIIVGDDGFRSFSAMRTQSPNRPPPSHYQMDAVANGDFNNWVPGIGGGGGGGMVGNNGQQSSLMLQEQIVSNQIEQKERLSMEVITNKQRLNTLQTELRVLEENLTPLDLNRIEYEILELQQECQELYDEGDRTVNGRFIPDMNLLALNDSPNPNMSNRPPRPPRPPPPRRQNHQQPFEQPPPPYNNQMFEPSIAEDDNNNNNCGPWTCNMCTFQNHELMTRCEVCAMPKISGSTKKLTYTRPSPPPPLQSTATMTAAPQLQNMKLLKAAPPDNDDCSPINGLLNAINNNNEIDVPNFCMNTATNSGQPQAAGVPLNGNLN